MPRWVDPVLSCDFVIELIPGGKKGSQILIRTNQIKKQNLLKMTRNLRLRQLAAFVTRLQHFLYKFPKVNLSITSY